MANVGRGRDGWGEGIQGAIDVGDSQEDVEAVVVGGPNEPSGLDLNQPIEVDTCKTPPKKSLRRRINFDKRPPQKLTPGTKDIISSNDRDGKQFKRG